MFKSLHILWLLEIYTLTPLKEICFVHKYLLIKEIYLKDVIQWQLIQVCFCNVYISNEGPLTWIRFVHKLSQRAI